MNNKAFYEEHGYLILEDFATQDEVKQLKSRMEELVEENDIFEHKSVFSSSSQEHTGDEYFMLSADRISYFLEKNYDEKKAKIDCLNKVGHALHDLDPVFQKFSYQDKMYNLMREMGMDDPRLISSMYIFKPPRIGGEVLYHQDSTFLHTQPDTTMALWLALDDATDENGCLYILPGQHRIPLNEQYVKHSDGTTEFIQHNDLKWPEDIAIPVEVKAGTLVLMHGHLPHASEQNRSKKQRHALALHAYDGKTDYVKENWLQKTDGKGFRKFPQHKVA